MERVKRNTRNKKEILFETDDHAQSGRFSSSGKMTTVNVAVLDEGIYVIVDVYNPAMTTQPNCGEPSTNLLGSAKRCEVTTGGHRTGNESVDYDISCTVGLGFEDHSLAHHSSNGVFADVDFSLCRKSIGVGQQLTAPIDKSQVPIGHVLSVEKVRDSTWRCARVRSLPLD